MIIKLLMEYYQYFWQHNFTHNKIQMLLVDFDTFINSFSEQIYRNTDIVLTALQRQYIKYLIDPENQNQVYKNAFLLFVRDFWSTPSNRTKLFSMKINLSKIQFKETMKMAGEIRLAAKYRIWREGQSSVKVFEEYLVKQDLISKISTNLEGQELFQGRALRNCGYITIGSGSQKCDIVMNNPFVNQQHIKLIYVTNLFQARESTPSFPVEPIPKNSVYIRDISKSNRIKEVLDNKNKMIVLKKGMVIGSVGLMEDMYEIRIDSIPDISEDEIKNIYNTLNADRVSYIEGEPDKLIQKIINYNMEEISESMIADLYDRNLYYPPHTKSKSSSRKDKNDITPLKFTIRNLRTMTETSCNSKNSKKLIIGRNSDKCDVIIDDVCIREEEFIFESINDMWFLKGINDVKVFLVPNGSSSNQHSNRQQLMEEYSSKFAIKNDISVQISVKTMEEQKQQLY